MPKVSIVTASYNYEDYIKETIESVINQTFQDWEMIIVDDGSKDNSVEVIKSYCEKDNRIKLFQHEGNLNKGLGKTLQLGLKQVRSEWVVFLESDDTITPDYLEEKFKILDKYPDVSFIYNAVRMFGDQEIIDRYLNGYLGRVIEFTKKITFPTQMLNAFRESKDALIPTFSVVMMKKNLFEDIDFNSPFKPYLDYYLWLQIVSKFNCEFFYIDKPLTNWRMHKKSFINLKATEKEFWDFELKKSVLLANYPRLFKCVSKKIKLSPIVSCVYSRKADDKRVKYKILGFKISYKRKNKK